MSRLSWENEPRTENQLKAIINMQKALGINNKIPETKGECSNLISKLKDIIQNNISLTGSINPSWIDDEDDSYDFMANDQF